MTVLAVQIQLWERGEKSVSLQDWDVSSVDALALRVGDTFRATVPHLLPMTEYEATVAVMNNYYVAAPSVTFGFITVSGREFALSRFIEVKQVLELHWPRVGWNNEEQMKMARS